MLQHYRYPLPTVQHVVQDTLTRHTTTSAYNVSESQHYYFSASSRSILQSATPTPNLQSCLGGNQHKQLLATSMSDVKALWHVSASLPDKQNAAYIPTSSSSPSCNVSTTCSGKAQAKTHLQGAQASTCSPCHPPDSASTCCAAVDLCLPGSADLHLDMIAAGTKHQSKIFYFAAHVSCHFHHG